MAEEIDKAYDPSDRESILNYALRLVGASLRDLTALEVIQDSRYSKGSLGLALEDSYFGLAPNSKSRADFEEAGLELKTTPLKKTKANKLSAKERLVLGMINYDEVVHESFETSHLLKKCSRMLLFTYLFEEQLNPVDYTFQSVNIWQFPPDDLPTIKHDWQTIVDKIRAGKAHEISSSDTLYLEACTKAATGSVRRSQPYSDIPAKPRAWALKRSYMDVITAQLLKGMQSIKREADEADLSLYDLVWHRFSPYFGKTQDELASHFGYKKKKN